MTFPLDIPRDLRRAVPPGASVLVALSGGVDSAVALAVLSELGCEVQAVTFKNFCYGETADPGDRACCSADAIEDARALAHRHGARHWVSDVSDVFRARVIEPFIREYAAARTPNPCLACNSTVRFPHLIRLADQAGCAFVATGHYARTDPPGAADCRLLRGVDPEKDQAYFLSGVARELLPRVLFPLGWFTKTEVRTAARALGLPVAEKLESQEICFVPDGDRTFLFDEAALPGEIVDRAGRVLGEHRGLIHYTVGQRRGLGVAAPEPLYVLALDRDRNRLVAGPEEALLVTRLVADRFQAQVPDFPDAGPPVPVGGPWTARIRHRQVGIPVAGWRRRGDDEIVVTLAAPVRGAAPGQGLVLYQGDTVVGGGRLIGAANGEQQTAQEE